MDALKPLGFRNVSIAREKLSVYKKRASLTPKYDSFRSVQLPNLVKYHDVKKEVCLCLVSKNASRQMLTGIIV
ncbi:hypothetical protein IX95_12790 [Vibrio sp. B183]|nr:hypothetical protein IX95_12790 [Vibrio sp. B183]